MKIIIVDDEMSALHTFLNDVIGRTDVEYKFFKDNEDEICDYLLKNKVAAAFLDVKMPKINGIELAQKIIGLCPDIKIVFITGLDVSRKDLKEPVLGHTAGFLYKPYDPELLTRLLASIERSAPKLTVNMFGAFDCFINDALVQFSSRKSKELFALLLTYNGRALNMNDAISQLWPDMDTDKSKPLYRDAVWRLRKTLQEIDFNCVTFERARLTLDKQNIYCDYWEYLASGSRPDDIFLKSYDWSINYCN